LEKRGIRGSVFWIRKEKEKERNTLDADTRKKRVSIFTKKEKGGRGWPILKKKEKRRGRLGAFWRKKRKKKGDQLLSEKKEKKLDKIRAPAFPVRGA